MVWGSGMLADSRAGCLHWYQQLHRDGILHPCSPLLPRAVSHPIAGWLLRATVLLWMVASAMVRMIYLTWDTWERGKGATSPPYQALPWHVGLSSPQNSLFLAPVPYLDPVCPSLTAQSGAQHHPCLAHAGLQQQLAVLAPNPATPGSRQ